MSTEKHELAAKRLKVIFVFFALLITAILARAFQFQVLEHERFAQIAQSQQVGEVTIAAKRGDIADRNGKLLATSVRARNVAVDPSLVQNPGHTAQILAKVLKLDERKVRKDLSKKAEYVLLKRWVSPAAVKQLKEQKLKGIIYEQTLRRSYPNTHTASQIVGFTDVDGRGLAGFELFKDKELQGEQYKIQARWDRTKKSTLEGGLDHERAQGASIRLSLDLRIQHDAEEALAKMLNETNAKSASAIVLDVETSEILAMATVPHFNPNQISKSNAGERRNRAIVDVFEPGSTMKPFIVAAALDEGAYTAQDELFCEDGQWRVGGHTIRDHDPYGWLNMLDIIKHSSNICSAKIGQTLGNEKLYQVLTNLGFGRRTGTEFPGEAKGMLAAPELWSGSSSATISFGHGMAASLVQLAAAYRVLAKGGLYRAPTLIHSVEGPDGIEPSGRTRKDTRIFGADAVDHTVRMMEAVVGEGGTGRMAAVSGYRVAGKTGTSRKVVNGVYSNEHYRSSFVGFLPAEDPAIVIAVVVDEPDKNIAYYGGAVAGPIFNQIASNAMVHLKIQPTVTGDRPNPTVAAAIARAIRTGRPTISPALSVEEENTDTPSGTVPSFLGLSARQSWEKFQDLGLNRNIELVGSGAVVRQEPRPGTSLAEVDKVRLILGQR